MNIRNPKTLNDFPKFEVATVRRWETSPAGYTEFELHGQFDRVIDGIDAQWFWLLIGQENCLSASVKTLDKEAKTAVLTCDEKVEPNVAGQTLFYLSPYWNAYNVWMVLDPNWGWTRTRVEAADAVAQDYEAPEVSIVSGREVTIWTKLDRADRTGGQSRHYPADDQNAPPNPKPRLIPGGWGHEHCELCSGHIDCGEFGYRDPRQRWMCDGCNQRYVVPRDLSFVDEL